MALLRAAWEWAKFIGLVLLFLGMVSCAYWLDHLRFTV